MFSGRIFYDSILFVFVANIRDKRTYLPMLLCACVGVCDIVKFRTLTEIHFFVHCCSNLIILNECERKNEKRKHVLLFFVVVWNSFNSSIVSSHSFGVHYVCAFDCIIYYVYINECVSVCLLGSIEEK